MQHLGLAYRALLCLALAAGPLAGGEYRFLEGYSVLDTFNFPGLDPRYLNGTAGVERGIAVDASRGILYIARGLANVGLEETDQDGRPNAIAGPAVVLLTNYNGSNFRDTGLLSSLPNTTPVSFHQTLDYDEVTDRMYVFGGTNSGVTTSTPVVYSIPGGILGGDLLGGSPGASLPALKPEFTIPNDLGRNGSARGIAVRSVREPGGATVTTLYLAMSSHAQAWRNDNPDPFSPTYPWRRLWATQFPPRQNLASDRHLVSGSSMAGVAVDPQGHAYFSIAATQPARVWMVPSESGAADPMSLDFDDRALGGVNQGPNAVILPVVPRFVPDCLIRNGTLQFRNPNGLTGFSAGGARGLFVSLVGPNRGVARLMLDPPASDQNGMPVVFAMIADAFGGAATAEFQDGVLSTLRLKGAGGATQPAGNSKSLLYTDVNSQIDPTHLYFNAFVTDPAKGQSIPHAVIGKASIPDLPSPVALTSLTPAESTEEADVEVVLTGQNFTSTTSIRFGGVEVRSRLVVSPTQMRVVPPSRAAGIVSVAAQNPGSNPVVLPNAFRYTPRSVFPITLNSSNPNQVSITWRTIPGKTYALETSFDLQAASWFDYTSPFVATEAMTTVVLGPLEALGDRFFRVREQ